MGHMETQPHHTIASFFFPCLPIVLSRLGEARRGREGQGMPAPKLPSFLPLPLPLPLPFVPPSFSKSMKKTENTDRGIHSFIQLIVDICHTSERRKEERKKKWMPAWKMTGIIHV